MKKRKLQNKKEYVLLEGLEKISDMHEVVRRVKQNLSILYDMLQITPIDNFSEQCCVSRNLYANTHDWKNALMEEMWDANH